jgi:hypothetical protein
VDGATGASRLPPPIFFGLAFDRWEWATITRRSLQVFDSSNRCKVLRSRHLAYEVRAKPGPSFNHRFL